VKPKLRVVSGARAGYAEVFSKPSITIGRHASCEFRLDPEQDLDVSTKHAVILLKGKRWHVRDADSRNGTFVNGHRIHADTALDDTDQIGLGENGPVIEIRLVAESTPDGVVAEAPPMTEAAGAPKRMRETARESRPKQSTTQRIRVEVGKQTRHLRTIIISLLVVFVVVVGGLAYLSWEQGKRRAAEVAALQARTDSILRAADAAVTALRGQVDGLAGRLRESQTEVQNLQTELTTAHRQGRNDEVAALEQRLATATRTLAIQQVAASVDFATISAANQGAVAIIWVEFGRGAVATGTAFGVDSRGYLLTNRHVVAGDRGTLRPTRIAVRFADSEQTFRGRVISTAEDVDLALIKVDIPGGIPTVGSLSDASPAVRQGDPVALIGFPKGTELPMSGQRARTSLFAGTVSKALGDLVQIDGYGAEGASGSPIFDRNGLVVAILFGGEAGTQGRVLYGVPATYGRQLLAQLP
jgi:S1-C subfamily serine protease